MSWLVTGVAGFIGSHVARALLDRGDEVVGVDNLDPYYDPHLKLSRLQRLEHRNFRFVALDVADPTAVASIFDEVRPHRVIHLAAQAGVRHAVVDATPYARTNLMGFVHVAEGCRRHAVEHLVYASSSSVYGETSITPFAVQHPADHPVSLYAASKRANELLAHSYSHMYGVPTTGLRFFTVYGPWGRPDMAYYAFARAIVRGEPVRIFGDGSALRDFTYVDDIVEGVLLTADLVATPNPLWERSSPDPASSPSPYRVFNIGRGEQYTVNQMLDILESELGRKACRSYEGTQRGDVPQTHADIQDLRDATGFAPRVSLEDGLARFASWYCAHEVVGTPSLV